MFSFSLLDVLVGCTVWGKAFVDEYSFFPSHLTHKFCFSTCLLCWHLVMTEKDLLTFGCYGKGEPSSTQLLRQVCDSTEELQWTQFTGSFLRKLLASRSNGLSAVYLTLYVCTCPGAAVAGIFGDDNLKAGTTEAPLARETPDRSPEDKPSSKVIGKLPQNTEGAGNCPSHVFNVNTFISETEKLDLSVIDNFDSLWLYSETGSWTFTTEISSVKKRRDLCDPSL